MTDKNKIREFVEEIFEINWKRSSFEGYGAVTELRKVLAYINSLPEEPVSKDVLAYINSLPEEPVSKDLEEASIEYCSGNKGADARVRTAFVFGANWQKEQMIKNAVNAVVDSPIIGYDFPNIYPDYRELKNYCDRYSIKDNDEVKLIIIKEN